jgi:hypothetical protein
MKVNALPKFVSGVPLNEFQTKIFKVLKRLRGQHRTHRVGFVLGNAGEAHALSGIQRKLAGIDDFTGKVGASVEFPVFSLASLFDPLEFEAFSKSEANVRQLSMMLEHLFKTVPVTDMFLMPGWIGSGFSVAQRALAKELLMQVHVGSPTLTIVSCIVETGLFPPASKVCTIALQSAAA